MKVKKKEKSTPPVLRDKTIQSYTKVRIFFFKPLGVDSCRTNSEKRLKKVSRIVNDQSDAEKLNARNTYDTVRPYFDSIYFNDKLENTA